MSEENKLSKNELAKIAVLFVVSYIAIYLIYLIFPSLLHIGMRSWSFTSIFQFDVMTWFLPVPGFFLSFLVIDWINKYYETKFALSVAYPVLLFILSAVVYYINIYWYYTNYVSLGAGPGVLNFDFWAKFLDSAFLVFVIAAIFGWLARVIMARTKK